MSVSPVAGGGPPPLPSREVGGEWSEHVTEEGNTYWYNTVTGVSTWTNPHLKVFSFFLGFCFLPFPFPS